MSEQIGHNSPEIRTDTNVFIQDRLRRLEDEEKTVAYYLDHGGNPATAERIVQEARDSVNRAIDFYGDQQK